MRQHCVHHALQGFVTHLKSCCRGFWKAVNAVVCKMVYPDYRRCYRRLGPMVRGRSTHKNYAKFGSFFIPFAFRTEEIHK